jgi:hypothetical protein
MALVPHTTGEVFSRIATTGQGPRQRADLMTVGGPVAHNVQEQSFATHIKTIRLVGSQHKVRIVVPSTWCDYADAACPWA